MNDGPWLQALRTGHGVMVADMYLRPSGSEPPAGTATRLWVTGPRRGARLRRDQLARA
ncbi:hypothetical protein OG747_41385 [Streptomyces sp. NBC_01384]|uniref:hypothetical protein n=1 Tax=Streptomyces sp. NBC_01384 TaxID=2903847 RepID=UPI003245598F